MSTEERSKGSKGSKGSKSRRDFRSRILSTSSTSSTPAFSRRSFFEHVAGGVYGAALASLLQRDLYGEEPARARPLYDLLPRPPHFEPKARAVIHLYMNGGPSQMDLFDPKPMLDKLHGTQHFTEIAGEIENVKDAGAIMRSPYKFAQHGQSGMWVSDVMPHLANHVDDIALIRSMHTTNLT